jgi:Histidine kinase-, DNA gyrase B-, and HSP90-like ATPase
VNDKVSLSIVPAPRHRVAEGSEWAAASAQITIGKDILELLSTSMYVDPMTIYREYVQNAADAIDEAKSQGLLKSSGRVDISIDAIDRAIRIRDNGTGIPWSSFLPRLSSLGASTKRGTSARGFRGVGRLAGLGYCQELVFRSKTSQDSQVSELRWDCRALKAALRSAQPGQDLVQLVRQILSVRRSPTGGYPDRFFEVELRGVIRHRDDRLLNASSVSSYLAQVAPLPFSPDFTFGPAISEALAPYVQLGEFGVHINGSEKSLYRPHQNAIPIGDKTYDKLSDLQLTTLVGLEGEPAAIAWTLHHGYQGALPNGTLIKGIRVRVGNVQVGDNALLEDLFSEPRFNGWAIGEVHVIDPKILPNGRRDNFEQSVHFDNLLGQLVPLARDISQRCRYSSLGRKWTREFERHNEVALEKSRALARGGLSRRLRQAHASDIASALKGMKRVLVTRYIDEPTRAELTAVAAATEARVEKLAGESATAPDPLRAFKPQIRSAYQQVIALIHEFSSTRVVANLLVDKILTKLESESMPSRTRKRAAVKPKANKKKR